MTSFEHLSSTQKIRASLHRDVAAICSETCHFLGLEITKPAMEIVAELVYKKLSVYGTDIESFAKHAKRTTINAEDVKLLVRRCPSLKSHLNTLATATTSKEKKRKTIAAVRQTEIPIAKAKEPETPVQKQRETDIQVAKEKEVTAFTEVEMEKEENKKEKDENMSLDDLIDLTFD